MLDTLDPTATRTGEPPRTATRVPIGRHATGTLDLDLRHARVRETLLQIGAQGEILVQQLRIVAIGVPT